MITNRFTRPLLAAVVVAASTFAMVVGSNLTIASAATTPDPNCNTPNTTGGIGILETPANTNTSAAQYLTKTGTGYSSAGTDYTFTITILHSSTATFSSLTDCAYSTINGNPATATYNENISPINATFNSGTQSWTANFAQSVSLLSTGQPDQICDRVQLTGTDGTAFTDYSNLVSSNPSGSTSLAGTATNCGPNTSLPEVPATGLLAVAGLGVAGAAVYVWRRREQPSVTGEDTE